VRKILLVPTLLLLLVGLASVGVLAAAQLKVGPAVSLLQTAALSGPASQPESAEGAEAAPRGIMFSTDERVVNLADRGAPRYLKTQIVLEIAQTGERSKGALDPETYKRKQEELRKVLSDRMPIIDDQITMILSTRTAAELLTPEGKAQVKQELKDKLGRVMADRELMNVYFTQFVIQ